MEFLIVIAIIAILLPALGKSREMAKKRNNIGNLKIGKKSVKG